MSAEADNGIDSLPRYPCLLLPTDDRWLLRMLADLRPAFDTLILDLRTADIRLERRLLGNLEVRGIWKSSPYLSINSSYSVTYRFFVKMI